jgi:hypothetical protein
VLKQLNEYAPFNANHSAPKDLLRILRLLEEANAVVGRITITASGIPGSEDGLFLMLRVAVLNQALLEIGSSVSFWTPTP